MLKMKNLLMLIVLMFSLNSMAASEADLFKGAELAAKYQCGDGMKDYDFVSEYSTISQFDSSESIGNDLDSLKKLKEISTFLQANFESTCKMKKYLAGAWDFQTCLNKCVDGFKKKENFKKTCLAACNTLKSKIDSVVYTFGNAVSKKIVFTDSKCKAPAKAKINNTSRSAVKALSDDERTQTDESSTVGR